MNTVVLYNFTTLTRTDPIYKFTDKENLSKQTPTNTLIHYSITTLTLYVTPTCFIPLKGHFVVQQQLHTKLNCTTGDSLCWLMLLECINYTPCRWPFKGWNILELCIMLTKWWFNIMSSFVGIYFYIVIPVHRHEQDEGKLTVKCLSKWAQEWGLL